MPAFKEGLRSGSTFLVDNFLSHLAVTTGAIGNLGWNFTTIGNASTYAYQTGENGVLRLTTAATANGDGSAMHLFSDSISFVPGIEFGARIKYPVELASGNFRIGLDDSVTATSPVVGIWFDSDAGVLSCQADSANGDVSVAVTKHPDLTSGTTMVVDDWVDFEVRCGGVANANGGPAEIFYFVNGYHVGTLDSLIGSAETAEPKLAHWQDSGGVDAVALEISHFWLYIPNV